MGRDDRLSVRVLAGTAGLVAGLMASACSLTSTRPVQEMSYAEAALGAARELHADTLSPDLFRAATESFSSAKREYRLKNYEKARRFAARSMRFAEKAEFDAYLKGGATPEIASRQPPPEGASTDPEESMKKATNLRREMEEEQRRLEEERRRAAKAAEPDLPPEEEEGEAEEAPSTGDAKSKSGAEKNDAKNESEGATE